MAHATARGAYEALGERLNRFPQGAPPSELLYRILAMLFSEREAGLVARLPIRPFTARKAARTWGMRESEARTILDALASRAILIDVEGPTGTVYALPPPMAGFFEFSMMRVRDDIDQQLLERAVLPVHHRRGRLHPRPVHERRDAAGPRLRQRARAHGSPRRGFRHGEAHRRRGAPRP